MVAILIFGISLAGILGAYLQCGVRLDWSAESVAAQLKAQSGLEQCRAAMFDPTANPPAVQLVSSNFPARVSVLDQATGSGKTIYCTNTYTIQTLSTNPVLMLLRVDCTWCSRSGKLYTNTAITYRAPDQ